MRNVMASYRIGLGLVACMVGSVGCADLAGVGGSSKYACKAPEGVVCQSMTGTYYNGATGRDEQKPDTSRNRKSNQPAGRADEPQQAPRQIMLRAAKGLAPSPLRSKGKVLRLWIKPWEDSDRDLVDEINVYVQVDRGRWLVEHVQAVRKDMHAPLKPPATGVAAAPAQAATAQGAGATTVPVQTVQPPPITANGGGRAVPDRGASADSTPAPKPAP